MGFQDDVDAAKQSVSEVQSFDVAALINADYALMRAISSASASSANDASTLVDLALLWMDKMAKAGEKGLAHFNAMTEKAQQAATSAQAGQVEEAKAAFQWIACEGKQRCDEMKLFYSAAFSTGHQMANACREKSPEWSHITDLFEKSQFLPAVMIKRLYTFAR